MALQRSPAPRQLHRENRPDLPGEVSISCGEHNSALRTLLDSAGRSGWRTNEAFLSHWGSTEVDRDGWKHWYIGDSWFRGHRCPRGLVHHDRRAAAVARNRLATVMLVRALADSRDAGFTRAALSVDADNPTGALGIYQRCGFRLGTRRSVHARVLSVTE